MTDRSPASKTPPSGKGQRTLASFFAPGGGGARKEKEGGGSGAAPLKDANGGVSDGVGCACVLARARELERARVGVARLHPSAPHFEGRARRE